MKAKDMFEHFISRADWLERDKTVDGIIAGDPEKEVERCLVAWMPSVEAIRTAAERGFDMVLCHEATFWDHTNDTPEGKPHAADKLAFINETGIVILRNHDAWDRWPKIGIPWAWAKFLGVDGDPVATDNYMHRYDIAPVAFGEFAENFAKRTAEIGEPVVEVVGDPNQTVSKIGIGTGCGCSIMSYIGLGCDCSIVCDDGQSYWRNIQYAADRNHPVICVNHATSEEPGMMTLAQYVNDNIEGVAAEHLPQGCRFRPVGKMPQD